MKTPKKKKGWELHYGLYEAHFNGSFYDKVKVEGIVFFFRS